MPNVVRGHVCRVTHPRRRLYSMARQRCKKIPSWEQDVFTTGPKWWLTWLGIKLCIMIGSPAQIEDWESDILRTQDQENEQCLLQKYNNIRFLDDEDNQTYVIASEYLKFKGPPEGIGSILWLVIPSIVDLVQLKTSTFSTRALILVHFNNVH